MNYFFLRFLPYLYYFIRGQYRRDVMGPVPDKKKRFKYRTVIAILLSVLILLSFAGIIKYRQLSMKITELNDTAVDTQGSINKIADRQSNRTQNLISRETYERDITALVYENTRLQYESDFLVNDLAEICRNHPLVCNDEVHHMIANHKSKNAGK